MVLSLFLVLLSCPNGRTVSPWLSRSLFWMWLCGPLAFNHLPSTGNANGVPGRPHRCKTSPVCKIALIKVNAAQSRTNGYPSALPFSPPRSPVPFLFSPSSTLLLLASWCLVWAAQRHLYRLSFYQWLHADDMRFAVTETGEVVLSRLFGLLWSSGMLVCIRGYCTLRGGQAKRAKPVQMQRETLSVQWLNARGYISADTTGNSTCASCILTIDGLAKPGCFLLLASRYADIDCFLLD